MRKLLYIILCFALAGGIFSCGSRGGRDTIDLQGMWDIRLDPDNRGIDEFWYLGDFSDKIRLPGTSDEAGFGQASEGSDYGQLTRVAKYIGPAWYKKRFHVPRSWRRREVSLFLERVLWESRVWLDGELVSIEDHLAAPHNHRLGRISPGNHELIVRINNEMIHNIGDKGHAYGEAMQTIWNGVVGRLELQARDALHVSRIRTFPDAVKKELGLEINISNPGLESGKLVIEISEVATETVIKTAERLFSNGQVQTVVAFSGEIQEWNEFTPQLYRVSVSLFREGKSKAADRESTTFGFSQVSHNGSHILINGKPLFLRGNLDCIHFPLTGYPAMTTDQWRRIFQIYRDNGLNHVRFHSWCPPEAAFQAADELGIYIQAEASVWIDGWMARDNPERPEMNTRGRPRGLGRGDRDADAFIESEIQSIISSYGNHPSFILFCIGNELGSSNFRTMERWIKQAKTEDSRRLYATSTARKVTAACDYSATHYYPNVGRVRQRLLPRNDWNYESEYSQTPVPVIAHEIGQWPVYPVWSEIEKYTGVLRARNLQELSHLADIHGIADMDGKLRRASGALCLLLYKDEIESFLRTPSCAGFQLLSMQDYAGQGEALVGWLDSFYDSKGIAEPEFIRSFMGPTVPLLQLPKYVWYSNETLTANAKIHHFGNAALVNAELVFEIKNGSGKLLQQVSFGTRTIEEGTVANIGKIQLSLDGVATAGKFQLELFIRGTTMRNYWQIWVYPREIEKTAGPDIIIAERFDDSVKQALKAGRSVLLQAHGCGDPLNSQYAAWRPLYWSGSWFPTQSIKTLGLLIQSEHPAFAKFPTDSHSDWQWWHICEGAHGFILDALPHSYRPLAQPVSDFHFNHKLGSIFELAVAGGKLLVCGYDIRPEREVHPEVRQLKESLIAYMNSEHFKPAQNAGIEYLDTLFYTPLEVIAKGPDDFKDAIFYVQAAGNLTRMGENVPWKAELDRVLVSRGVNYGLRCNGLWGDEVGRAWFGRRIELKLQPPQGMPGNLYIHLHDWNNLGRNGVIRFEGRSYSLGNHGGDGLWIKLPVMREDSNDGQLIFEAEGRNGPNLMITAVALIPDKNG